MANPRHRFGIKSKHPYRLLPTAAAVGLAFGFAAIALAATASTTVSSDLGAVISVSSSGTVDANVVPSSSGAQTIASDTVSVSTNDSSGYTLQIAETGSSTSLVYGGNSIAATAGTWAVPVDMAVNTWGYRVDGIGNFSSGTTSAQSSAALSGSINFAAVPATASPQTLMNTSGTATNSTTTVWYGVAANTTLPSGIYSNSVTYTATAN